MQVITALLSLLALAEAGPIAKAPRTASPGTQTTLEIPITFTLASPTTTTTTTTATMTTTTTTTTTTTRSGSRTSMSGSPTHAHNPPIGMGPGFVGITFPQPTAASTPTPTPTPGPDRELLQAVEGGVKFVQTTYSACVTFPHETHCGWHEPILDASATGRSRGGGEGIVARAGVIAAGVVLALAYGS
ncbi:hypothetical protein F4802DRAFT_29299 [Xylaria palmicola]|nr:hypothetical protein F4802DRAFT_29299 [Xylaria palmicola]